MAVTPGFEAFVIDQLEGLGPAVPRRMFGGVGIYFEEHFFAIIHDDRLYLKVDDSNRPDFEEHGMEPFRPYGDERSMSYYEVPVDILEDRDRLKDWAEKAVAVARRKKRSR